MKKYQDAWVVDRTMIDYVNQSGGCCGKSHTIMDIATFAQTCSDWESDEETKEHLSPWPTPIHHDILTDRGKLRCSMKNKMIKYKTFYETYGELFQIWWNNIKVEDKMKILRLPQDDVIALYQSEATIQSSYIILMHAIAEQLKHFQETGYKDARSSDEVYFECHLKYEHGAFVVSKDYCSTMEGMTSFIEMIRRLGGPKLLPTADEENNQSTPKDKIEKVQSFRGDRRLMRLVIFRTFVDMAIRKFIREESTRSLDTDIIESWTKLNLSEPAQQDEADAIEDNNAT